MNERLTPTLTPEDSGQPFARDPGPLECTGLECTGLECTAQRAECTCPEFCERDHANE
jgi:hypothetical protein